MNALSHDFDLSHSLEITSPSAILSDKWNALHDAAAALAQLAQLAPEKPDTIATALPALVAEGPRWRSEAIERGVDDLSAVMQAGLRALIAACDDGRDTTAAAITLWREFHAARQAIYLHLDPEARCKRIHH